MSVEGAGITSIVKVANVGMVSFPPDSSDFTILTPHFEGVLCEVQPGRKNIVRRTRKAPTHSSGRNVKTAEVDVFADKLFFISSASFFHNSLQPSSFSH